LEENPHIMKAAIFHEPKLVDREFLTQQRVTWRQAKDREQS
jgi:hypothetical protein